MKTDIFVKKKKIMDVFWSNVNNMCLSICFTIEVAKHNHQHIFYIHSL